MQGSQRQLRVWCVSWVGSLLCCLPGIEMTGRIDWIISLVFFSSDSPAMPLRRQGILTLGDTTLAVPAVERPAPNRLPLKLPAWAGIFPVGGNEILNLSKNRVRGVEHGDDNGAKSPQKPQNPSAGQAACLESAANSLQIDPRHPPANPF